MSLRLAIIGCGAIADEMHLPTVHAHPGVTLSAVVDPDLERARSVAARWEAKSFASTLDAVDTPLDAAIICTPPGVRPQLIAAAFQRGLHVLAEKPLANSVSECHEIIEGARSSGRVLAVSHMFRFYPVRARLQHLLAEHGLSHVRAVRMHEGAPYAWSPRSGYTFKRSEVSGGVLVNAGIHSLDSLIHWFGDPSIESYEDDAIGGLESNAKARLAFRDGIVADFRISRTCRLPSRFEITCERGQISFTNRDTIEYSVERDGRRSLHRVESGMSNPAQCWLAQLDDFVGAIHSGVRPQIDGNEATRVVRLVEDLYGRKRTRPLPAVTPTPGQCW